MSERKADRLEWVAMEMRRDLISVLVAATVLNFLAGCENASQVDEAEFARLELRVSTLEENLAQISAQRVAQEEAQTTSIRQESVAPEQRATFQLVGTAHREERTLQYDSSEECERARQTLLESWAIDDERRRSQGVVYTNRPTPTCVPL